MKTLLSLLTLIVSASAWAAYPPATEIEYQLNRGTEAMRRAQLGTQITQHKVQVLKAVYDFSLQGGSSAGAVSLLDADGKAAVLPNKAIIKNVLIDVVTALTSGGSATVAIGSGQAANDLKAALAIASYTGRVAGVPVNTAATAIKLTANRTPTVTIATAPLTAGKLNIFIEYLLSD